MKNTIYLLIIILIAIYINACTIDKHNMPEPEDKEIIWWKIPYFYGLIADSTIQLQSGRDTIIYTSNFSQFTDTGFIHRTYTFALKNSSRFFEPDSIRFTIGPVKFHQDSGITEDVFLNYFNTTSFNYILQNTSQTGVIVRFNTDSSSYFTSLTEQPGNSFFNVSGVKEMYSEPDEEGNKELEAVFLRAVLECTLYDGFDNSISLKQGEMVGIYLPF